jgi:integrase
MTSQSSNRPVSALRARMIEDMSVRGFSEKTRSNYIREVRAFAAFIRRPPDTATVEDLRRFQLHQTQSGMQPPSINSAVSALRFFFTVTLDRADLARRLTVVRQPRRLPTVLSVEEITLLLQVAPGPKYKAAFATAYGAGLRVSEVVALKVTQRAGWRSSENPTACVTDRPSPRISRRSAGRTGSSTPSRPSPGPRRFSPISRATPTASPSRTAACSTSTSAV